MQEHGLGKLFYSCNQTQLIKTLRLISQNGKRNSNKQQSDPYCKLCCSVGGSGTRGNCPLVSSLRLTQIGLLQAAGGGTHMPDEVKR